MSTGNSSDGMFRLPPFGYLSSRHSCLPWVKCLTGVLAL